MVNHKIIYYGQFDENGLFSWFKVLSNMGNMVVLRWAKKLICHESSLLIASTVKNL